MSASSDVDASEYLGTTSVRLIMVGNVVHAIFSSKLEAKPFYDDVASTLKRRGPFQEQVTASSTRVTKRKKEGIGAVAEAWHQAFVALANKTKEKTVPHPGRN